MIIYSLNTFLPRAERYEELKELIKNKKRIYLDSYYLKGFKARLLREGYNIKIKNIIEERHTRDDQHDQDLYYNIITEVAEIYKP